jgi:RNA polymerase sigma-70 factor (ECF subfamily)
MAMEIDHRSDAELVAETLSGDGEAFGQLYDRHARMVRAVVLSVSCDWQGAEDMVQECFLRAYRKLASLRDREQFGAWVVGIARQVGRERRRALARDRHEFGDAALDDAQPAAEANGQIHINDQIQEVLRRLEALDEKERLAIHTYFLEERCAVETAELMGLSRSGFYALVRRAIVRLAAALKTAAAGAKVSER